MQNCTFICIVYFAVHYNDVNYRFNNTRIVKAFLQKLSLLTQD